MALKTISNSLSSAAARPVSSAEFANALFSIWRQKSPQWNARRTNTFGLAISGGVDSMALAALFTNLRQARYESLVSELEPSLADRAAEALRDLELKAFIVDHGVRDESASEAKSVSSVLEQRGIETQILKIDWGSHSQPGDSPNFETLARKYRFQALGKACRDSKIDSLFFAHHQNDQVETVMMRLINGQRGFGLAGIKRANNIPECYGIHGVHESGGHPEPCLLVHKSRRVQGRPAFMEIETGGIHIYRPLLNFRKNRLKATCEEADIKWFEDHTNTDPTVTSRNAIRHMYNSHAMPAALSPSSIIRLSEAFDCRYQKLSEEADSRFKGSMRTLEPRSGVLSITFPDLQHLNASFTKEDTRLVAALLLLKAIQYVTPEQTVNLNSLHGFVAMVFPETQDGEPPVTPPAFTTSGVYFRRIPLSNAEEESGEKCKWHLSRQRYMSNETNQHHIIVPPTPKRQWSPWTLFDGRFWIRTQNMSGAPITIRPYQKDDKKKYLSLSGKESPFPSDTLKALAHGHVRWTLPVIAVQRVDGTEGIFAFPTLNARLLVPENPHCVNWQVRYKKVDMENIKGQWL